MDYQLKSGNILRVVEDTNPENPRENDNLGTMICHHGNYRIGDKQIEGQLAQLHTIAKDINILPYIVGLDKEYQYDIEKLECFINAKEGAVVIKLFLYEHSGIRIDMYQSTCRWDSSNAGYIYVSKERIIEEYGDASPESVEKAKAVLEAEVETYNKYLAGEVYGFRVIKRQECNLGHIHEEILDSCWGFYEFDPKVNGMLDYIDDELLIPEPV